MRCVQWCMRARGVRVRARAVVVMVVVVVVVVVARGRRVARAVDAVGVARRDDD